MGKKKVVVAFSGPSSSATNAVVVLSSPRCATRAKNRSA